jgi:long-chain fatty acid transport protein
MNGGNSTKEYEGKAQAIFIPSVMAAYKWQDFVFSGSFAIVGGGGTLKFDNGLPMFEAGVLGTQVAPGQTFAQALGALNGVAGSVGYAGAPLGYSLNMNLEGTSITYGTQLGVTYKINDMFSGFVGARASFVTNGYDGYLRDVAVTNGAAVKAHLNATADALESIAPGDAAALRGAAGTITALEQGVSTQSIELDTQQSGWGIAPILGVNFNYEKLNVGVKYDFKTDITLKNDTKKDAIVDGTPMFPDGAKSHYDIPALLSVGASYKFLDDKLTASAGYHVFFDKDADYSGDSHRALDGNLREWLAGVEYQICDHFLISAGGQLTRQGVTDAYLSDLSFTSNSYSIGMGTKIKITEKLSANVAYFFTNYEDYTKKNTFGPNSKTVYSRTNNAFGIGLDYKF